ncbi:hypothetical protein E4P39_05820 [Blastococcus sp. CT_GayMR19]|nr:hypothetical protein E4P39_05820 [Blastococcus sp. CT_GayMR19]
MVPDGVVPDGPVSDGVVTDGLVSDGVVSDGLGSDGLGSDGVTSTGAAGVVAHASEVRTLSDSPRMATTSKQASCSGGSSGITSRFLLPATAVSSSVTGNCCPFVAGSIWKILMPSGGRAKGDQPTSTLVALTGVTVTS